MCAHVSLELYALVEEEKKLPPILRAKYAVSKEEGEEEEE